MAQTEEEWQRCQFCGNPDVEIIYEDGRCNQCHGMSSGLYENKKGRTKKQIDRFSVFTSKGGLK